LEYSNSLNKVYTAIQNYKYIMIHCII